MSKNTFHQKGKPIGVDKVEIKRIVLFEKQIKG